MVIKMTLTILLIIFIKLSLIPISFHFIFLLFFNIKTKLWLNKYKNILLSDNNIFTSYKNLVLSKENISLNIDNSSYFIKILRNMYNNYIDFHFFEKFFKNERKPNYYDTCISEFNKIKIYFLIDTLSLKIFTFYIQFLLVFASVVAIHSAFMHGDILFNI